MVDQQTADTATTTSADTSATTTSADTTAATTTAADTAAASTAADTVAATDTTTATATKTEVKADWPETWRERMAGMTEKDGKWTGGDEKLLKRLQRMASPLDTGKTLREQDVALSKRAVPGLPKDATPEQVAAYREALGIPEKPDGYDVSKLPSGIVIGEADKPLVSKFLERMHAEHATPNVVKAALDSYYAIKEEEHTAWVEHQEAVHAETTQALQQEWGQRYLPTVNSISNFMVSTFGEEVAGLIEHATLPDGTVLGNHVGIMQGLARAAFEVNPAGVVAPNGTGGQMQSIDAELAKIDEQRKTNYHGFMRNEPLRARERELLDAKAKMTARGAA